jgi:hypothetical protein
MVCQRAPRTGSSSRRGPISISRSCWAAAGEPVAEASWSTRGAPYNPIRQGKIERHILLENYFLRGDLEAQIGAFVDDYNHRRYHESIDNLTRGTSTSGAVQPSWRDEQGSNDRPFPTVACSTGCRPADITQSMRQSLLSAWPVVSKTLTTDKRDLLAPVFGWFAEGFDTADLREAADLACVTWPCTNRGYSRRIMSLMGHGL